MGEWKRRAIEAAERIRPLIVAPPVAGLLTGTGLGEVGAGIDVDSDLDYRDLPHFPASTVESHAGRLLVGRLAGRGILVFQGRFHLYEGYTPRQVSFPVRVMQELGVPVLVVTNAAGGLHSGLSPGEVMILSDHINLSGGNPLVGPNEDGWGDRFPDMAAAYDPRLADLAEAAAEASGVRVRRGVYAGLRGPCLETPAEVRFLRTIGADAVGFSTVQEVIAAVHARIRVLGLSTITNVHRPEAPEPASVQEILRVAGAAAPGLSRIVRQVVAGL